MQHKNMEANLSPSMVYKPQYRETQMVKFQKFVEEKHKIKLNDYWDFHKWSVEHYPEFWDCVWKFFDIACFQPYTEVYNKKNDFCHMEWFKDARINYAANVLKYKDSNTAIIECDEDDNIDYITYSQLYEEVKIYIQSLKDCGVAKGDVVGVYMRNKKEGIFAFLATACLGALWCGTLPLMGVKGALSRFQQKPPKVLFTAGNFYFEGQEVKIIERLPTLIEALPNLKQVVFVPSKNKNVCEKIDNIPKCVFISEFLKKARCRRDLGDIQFEAVPFDYPLTISFTSGTTGPPKRLIHSHGSFITTLKEKGIHLDCTRKDVFFNLSPVGWISWNMFVNTLHLGSTLVCYDGYPFEHSPTRYWDIVDKFGVTSSYIWSSTVEDLEKNGHIPQTYHSLKTLKNLCPNGSPLKPHGFDFLATIKPGLFFSPVYGTTEVFGLLSAIDHNLPIYKGELQVPSLGIDLNVLDREGNIVIGERGEVVVSNPHPALPIDVLNNKNENITEKNYLRQYPGHWFIGDDAWINPVTKGIIVYGRSDETMNPKGARFNCAEIYFALEEFPGIKDSVCTSQHNSNFDERVVLFVKMLPGYSLTEETKNKIKSTIADSLTIEHVPEIILQVPDIPYNLTGKKLNGLVKNIINKKSVLNAEIVVNPLSLEFFKEIDLGEF